MAEKQSSKRKRVHTQHCVSHPTEEFERTLAKNFPFADKMVLFRLFCCSTALPAELLTRGMHCRVVPSSSGDTEATHCVRKIERRSFRPSDPTQPFHPQILC